MSSRRSGSSSDHRSAACGASIGIGLRACGTGLDFARARFRRRGTSRPATRSSTRSRAARAASGNDPAGAVRAIAARRPAARPRPVTACAAPCRNRPATPRGRPPDFRHKAQASDRARGLRPCESALKFERAHDLPHLWRPDCARSRGSSRRATCMVIVEPPETMWPLAIN